MIKYQITDSGLKKNMEYSMINSNTVSVEEKILSVMSSGIGCTATSIYNCVRFDRSIRKNHVTEGTIGTMLKAMEQNGYVTSYDQDKLVSGGGTIGNI